MQWVLIARSPAAVQSQYSQFTGHCAPRARRPPRVIPAAGGGPRARVPARSDGAGTAPPGGRRSRQAAGSAPAASPACWPRSSSLLLEWSPIHVPATRSRPGFCSRCPGKRELLSCARRRGQQQAALNSDSALAAGKPGNRSRTKNPRQVASGTVQWRPLASRSGPRPGPPRAPKSSPSHLQRHPESPSLLTPKSSGFSFFLNNSAQGH